MEGAPRLWPLACPFNVNKSTRLPRFLSPVQIKSAGDEEEEKKKKKGGMRAVVVVVVHWHGVHSYSTALYLPLNPICNKSLCVIFDLESL